MLLKLQAHKTEMHISTHKYWVYQYSTTLLNMRMQTTILKESLDTIDKNNQQTSQFFEKVRSIYRSTLTLTLTDT